MATRSRPAIRPAARCRLGQNLCLLQTVQGGGLSTFVLSNPDGDIIAASSSDPTFRRVRLADRDYFRYHLPRRDQQFPADLPVISRATGKRIIPVSIAIRDPQGNLRAVLSASILSNYLGAITPRTCRRAPLRHFRHAA